MFFIRVAPYGYFSVIRVVGFLTDFNSVYIAFRIHILIYINRIVVKSVYKSRYWCHKAHYIRRTAGAIKHLYSLSNRKTLFHLGWSIYIVKIRVDFKRIFIEERFTVQWNSRHYTVIHRSFDNIRISWIGTEFKHTLGKHSKWYCGAGFGISRPVRQIVVDRKWFAHIWRTYSACNIHSFINNTVKKAFARRFQIVVFVNIGYIRSGTHEIKCPDTVSLCCFTLSHGNLILAVILVCPIGINTGFVTVSAFINKIFCKLNVTLFAGCFIKPYQSKLYFRMTGSYKSSCIINFKSSLNVIRIFFYSIQKSVFTGKLIISNGSFYKMSRTVKLMTFS